jgi:hypothetical protein
MFYGQSLGSGVRFVWQSFVRTDFTADTDATPVSAYLRVQAGSTAGTGTARDMEFRPYNWGTSVTTGNWRTPAQLGALPLAGRVVERLVLLGLGTQCDHPHTQDREPGGGQALVGTQAGGDRVAHRPDAPGEHVRQAPRGDEVQGVLLRGLGQQAGDLVERAAAPAAVLGVDREVDAAGDRGRVHDAEADRGLGGQVLEVRGARVEEQRQLAVVDGHLGQDRGERAVPERGADAAVADGAVVQVLDVGGGAAAQVAEEGVAGDVGHLGLRVCSSDLLAS